MKNSPEQRPGNGKGLLQLLLWICCCAPPALRAQEDTITLHYPDFATFGEHAFRVTRNEYIGKIAPTEARPYETTVYVAVGENETHGYLAVTADNIWENELIDGEVTLLLGNDTRLICRKKRLYQTTGKDGVQIAVALYFLTFPQLRQVARHGIKGLLFPLVDTRTNNLLSCELNHVTIQFHNK